MADDYQLQPVDNDPFAVPDSSKIAVMPPFARAPQAAEDIAKGVAEPLTTAGWMLGGAMQGTEKPSTVDVLKAIGGIGLAAMPMGPGRATALARGVEEAATPAIRAFHGSPHDFDAFDLSKIGTGEGAQAYGHGLYFAENEATAKAYRDALSGQRTWNIPPETIIPEMADFGFAPKALELARNTLSELKGDGAQAVGLLDQLALNGNSTAKEAASVVRSFHRNARTNPGKMYEVNIKANPEEDFLHLDKPLNEQSPKVRQFFEQGKFEAPVYPDTPGKHLPDFISPNPAVAAEKMREAGIAGIKYADQGSRMGGQQWKILAPNESVSGKWVVKNGAYDNNPRFFDNEKQARAAYQSELDKGPPPTHNYVVFSDKLIDIVKKYGIAGAIGAGAYHFKTQPVDHDPFASGT